MDNLAQLGIGGIFSLMVIEKVFTFIKERRVPTNKKQLDEIHSWSKDLHQWHSKEDSEGRKVWYHKESLELSITKLAESISTQTQVMQAMLNKINESEYQIREIKNELHRNKE